MERSIESSGRDGGDEGARVLACIRQERWKQEKKKAPYRKKSIEKVERMRRAYLQQSSSKSRSKSRSGIKAKSREEEEEEEVDALLKWTSEIVIEQEDEATSRARESQPEAWLDEMIQAPPSSTPSDMIELQKDVAEQLISHAHIHSPALSRLLSKAWDVNYSLARSMVRSLDESGRSFKQLEARVHRLVAFSEKEVQKHRRHAREAKQRANFAEREIVRLSADAELAESKLESAQLEIAKLRALISDLRQDKIVGGKQHEDVPDDALESALGRIDRESAMQQKYARDMDALVRKLKNQSRRAESSETPAAADAASQTERASATSEGDPVRKERPPPPPPPARKKRKITFRTAFDRS